MALALDRKTVEGRRGGDLSLFKNRTEEQDPQFVVWLFNTLKALFLLSWPSARTLEEGQRVIFFLPELVIVVNLSIAYACWFG